MKLSQHIVNVILDSNVPNFKLSQNVFGTIDTIHYLKKIFENHSEIDKNFFWEYRKLVDGIMKLDVHWKDTTESWMIPYET